MSEIVEVIQPADTVVEVLEQVTDIVEVVERGLRGEQGVQGPTGPQGATGATGSQGPTGLTGATGATGATGPSGVVSVTAPITNSGSSTSAVIGVDQSQFVIAQSQVTGLAAALAAEASLAGGNSFTGTQVMTTSSPTAVTLQVKPTTGQTANVFELFNTSGSASLVITQAGGLLSGGTTRFTGGGTFGGTTSISSAGLSVYAPAAAQAGAIIRGAASQTANLQEWQNSAGSVLASIDSGGLITTTSYININNASSGIAQQGTYRIRFANGIVGIGSTAPAAGSGASGALVYVNNLTTAPTANATGGGYLYAEGGALKWRGSSGTITTIAAA